jgi:hypothetical protein
MPAQSRKQQRFFGLVKAIQEGKAIGSGKAEEAAVNMSKKDVRDFAKTKHEDLPESEKISMDPNVKQLLNYAAISTGVGLGAAGLYGLGKYLHDKSMFGLPGQESRIKTIEKRIAIPKSRKLEAYMPEDVASPADMLPEKADETTSDLSKEIIEDMENPKEPGEKVSNLKSYLTEPMLYGIATPTAMLAPGILTFMLGTRLIDQSRKQEMDKKIEKAKKEFELALSKKSSDIQLQIDGLAKQAWDSIPRDKIKKIPDPYGVNFSVPGVAYAIGLAPGVGALLGWLYMQKKMENDPEKAKLKTLQSMLKRDIASGALSSGIDLEETDEGKPKFKL